MFSIESMPPLFESTARQVEGWLAKPSRGGSIFLDNGNGIYAFGYALHLHNTSQNQATVRYQVTMADPSKENRLVDALRIVFQTPEGNAFYARSSRIKNELGDYRAPIADYRIEQNSEGARVAKSLYSSEGNDGYCLSFKEDSPTGVIIESEINLPKDSFTRFTFAMYLEGYDEDTTGPAPTKSKSPQFSLHFLD